MMKPVALTSKKGQSIVEFAMVIPLFLFLLVGIAEFGRAWMTRNIMTGAAREAVRIAAVQGNTASAMARANNILASAGLAGASVALNDDGAAFGTYAATVTYNFPITVAGFLPGISGASIPLTSSTSMRKEF
jgi:Flp pilus assembly protein TadG